MTVAAPALAGTMSRHGEGPWLALVNYQGQLHHQLADALRALRDGSTLHAALVLGGLSLLYGVVHAVGPGHGKAVVSSYLVADGRTIRSGIALAFAAALAQAMTAVLIVLIGWFGLGLAGFQLTQVAAQAESASFALVGGLGCAMIVNGAARLFGYVRELRSGSAGYPHDAGRCEESAHCASCGHNHAPMLPTSGPNPRWHVAGIILAVGARPCSGALIVLVFALVNGLLLAGIASTLAMALGTAVTVSALAALSVQAKLIALRLFSVSGVNMRLLSGMLWLGGGTVIATMGIGMFLAPSPVAPF